MDHLAMKHFRDQMISELRKDKPMKCPRCDGFESKDRQQLFRHMISKHKVLDHYLVDAIQKMREEGKQPFGAAAAVPAAASAVVPAAGSTPAAPAAGPSSSSSSLIVRSVPATEPAAATSSSEASSSSSLVSTVAGPSKTTSITPVAAAKEPELPTVPASPAPAPAPATTPVPVPPPAATEAAPAPESSPTEQVTLAEFMEKDKKEKEEEKIMQVDGADSCSDCSEDACSDILQLDGAGDTEAEDTASSTGIDPGEDESEFFLDDPRGRGERASRMACPLCKEEMKFSKTYHFATTHFRPRLQRDLPTKKPFLCPDCGEEQQHKINLWSHYIGRAHKHLDKWLEEYNKAEVKPDWCDPAPANPRAHKRLGSGVASTSAASSPSSPQVTPAAPSVTSAASIAPVDKSSPSTATNPKEWFCDLCHGLVPQRREIHFASLHFKEKLKSLLPTQSPWVCPEPGCGAEHKHFLNLSTHFLTQHGHLKTWLEERGIAYEQPSKSKRSKLERQNSGTAAQASLPAKVHPPMETETKILMAEEQSHATTESGKHALSSSESESDEGDSDREVLLDKPVAASKLGASLGFLAEVKTEVDDVEVKTEKTTKKKRVKRQLEYDLLEVMQTLEDNLKEDSQSAASREPPPARVMTSSLMPGSREQRPPHTWLCDGRLLMLEENLHRANISIFQEQWRRGQPVIVANVSNKLDMNLWSPDAFNREFGDLKHDIVNCKTHKKIPQIPLKWFWDGFENLKDRLLDNQGMPMLLKLKDWPTEDDFKQYFPKRFADLMVHLPLSDYTRREGQYNLASFMPDYFLQPDLGPKMYIAYGSPLYPEYGSTNLHMDMSDAVNLMVYVGIPQDGNNTDTMREGLRAVDEAGCDIAMKNRIRVEGCRVGALWHIFHPRDADRIRDFLNKVTMEKGHKLEPHNDPIHDQSVYLTTHLRQRLFEEYGVEGYAIAQCEGDTVFIPAGAPHQVSFEIK